MNFTREGALYLPEPEPPALPEPVCADAEKCHSCGALVPEDRWGITLGKDGWAHHWWTCKHPRTWTCRECLNKGIYQPGCPVCGCECEYT